MHAMTKRASEGHRTRMAQETVAKLQPWEQRMLFYEVLADYTKNRCVCVGVVWGGARVRRRFLPLPAHKPVVCWLRWTPASVS